MVLTGEEEHCLAAQRKCRFLSRATMAYKPVRFGRVSALAVDLPHLARVIGRPNGLYQSQYRNISRRWHADKPSNRLISPAHDDRQRQAMPQKLTSLGLSWHGGTKRYPRNCQIVMRKKLLNIPTYLHMTVDNAVESSENFTGFGHAWVNLNVIGKDGNSFAKMPSNNLLCQWVH